MPHAVIRNRNYVSNPSSTPGRTVKRLRKCRVEIRKSRVGRARDTCMVNFSRNSIPFRVVGGGGGGGELFRANQIRFTSEEERLFGLTCLLFEPVR